MTNRSLLPTIAALALCTGLAQATTILTFDDLPGSGYVTNQYQDENFLVSQGYLYYVSVVPQFTPLSPPNMAQLDHGIGPFIFTPASVTWSDFGFYVTTTAFDPFSHPIIIMAYDAAGNPLGMNEVPVNVDYTNQFFGVDDQPEEEGDAESPQGASQDDPAVTGIASVAISVPFGGLDFIDNITFDNFSPAPEPASWAIMLIACSSLGAGFGAQRIRRRFSKGNAR